MSLPGNPPVTFAGGSEPSLPTETAEQLFRIAQEAVANAIRHAKAGRVSITLEPVPGGLELRVADDGVGFDAASPSTGQGQRIMAYRAALIGAALHIHPGPGGGTVVTCLAPSA
jgi:signal transduction histidine kinase